MTNLKVSRTRWLVIRCGFLVCTLVLITTFASALKADAAASDVIGGKCSTEGETLPIGNLTAKCTKVGKKLVWVKVQKTKSTSSLTTKRCSVENKVRIAGTVSWKATDIQQCTRNSNGQLTWLRLDTYTGPKVVAGLPFSRSIPTGAARDLAQAFIRDATDLLNCHYGFFDKCANAVWGRRDPWKMPLEGKAAAFNAPWAALWEKYEQAGVVVWQSNGPYTDRYPQGVPMLDFFYRLTIDGQTFELWMRDDPGHSLTNPSSWYIPGCAVCHAYEVHDS